MNLVDLLKKNIVMVPVVASVLVGTFTGVRYIVKLKPSIFTIWTWIRKASVTVLSLVFALFQEGLSYFTHYFPTAQSTIDCLSQRFSKNVFLDPKCRICRSTNYSCGTVLVIGLVFILLISWLA